MPLKPLTPFLIATLAGASVFTTSVTVKAADENERISRLTQQLIELRGSVNDLASQLDLNHESHKQTIRSLMTQKSQAESSVRQEKLSLDKLDESLEQQKLEIQNLSSGTEEIKVAVLDGGNKLIRRIESGIPFKIAERKSAVEDLMQRVRSSVVSPNRAANELWALYEDEIRLTSENGIYRQTLSIDDNEVLADIARIGSMMMFFKLDDQRYGFFKKNGAGWSAQMAANDQASKQIADLFDALQKQIRSGNFTLPNTL